MKILRFNVVLLLVILAASGYAQLPDTPAKARKSHSVYEYVDFEGLLRRYMAKPPSELTMEGIYSVTCIVTKKSKRFLSSREKEKIVLRKDNYAKVAILREWDRGNCEFIELSLDAKQQAKYPIVGEFNSLSEGQGYIYRHTEPKGKVISFTFANAQTDMIDGIFSEMRGRKTITYKMTYLKTFPKSDDQVVTNQLNR